MGEALEEVREVSPDRVGRSLSVVTTNKDLVPFNGNFTCAKCKCSFEAEVKWVAAASGGASGEHLHCKCKNCGFEWKMKTADSE